RVRAAFLELGFHGAGIEGRDAEGDVTDPRRTRDRRRSGAAIPASAPDDDVADVADLALALAALVLSRLPPEKRRVERDARLVVRHLERDVIEPHGVPRGRFERRGRGCPAACGALTAVPAVAVTDLQIEAARIFHVKALEILAAVVGDRVEAALPELRFNFFRVPRLDAEAEAVEHGVARRSASTAATTACGGLLAPRRRP